MVRTTLTGPPTDHPLGTQHTGGTLSYFGADGHDVRPRRPLTPGTTKTERRDVPEPARDEERDRLSTILEYPGQSESGRHLGTKKSFAPIF